jgi:hypothetical protein
MMIKYNGSDPGGIVIVSKLVFDDFFLSYNTTQFVFYGPLYFGILVETFFCCRFNQIEICSLLPSLQITLLCLLVDKLFWISAWEQFEFIVICVDVSLSHLFHKCGQ